MIHVILECADECSTNAFPYVFDSWLFETAELVLMQSSKYLLRYSSISRCCFVFVVKCSYII